MVQQEGEGVGMADLRQAIHRALQTTVRDALALAFEKLFPEAHPGKTPYKLAMAHAGARHVMEKNQDLRKRVKENNVAKLDMSALILLLETTCHLATAKTLGKQSCIKGSLKVLRKMRNEDAHWTQEGCPDTNLEAAWQEVVQAVTTVIQESGLQPHLARFTNELQNIRTTFTSHDQKQKSQNEQHQQEEEEEESQQGQCRQKSTGQKHTQSPQQLKETSNSNANSKLIRGSIEKELLELYQSGRKTTLMPLVWAGRNFSFHHRVQKTYTNTRLTILNQGIVKTIDSNRLLEEDLGTSRTIILQGESGTGKTSLLRNFAATWKGPNAPSSAIPGLSEIDFLIFLDCTAVTARTFTLSDIIQEVLPNTYSKWRPATILKELAKAEHRVMFLIDAFDERFEAFGNAFRNLQRKFTKAIFLITTRPHCLQSIAKLCEKEVTVVMAHGFNWSVVVDYCTKVFETCGKQDDVHDFFNVISRFELMATIPQLLCWCMWLWMEKGREHFLSIGKVFSSITDFLLRKLCHINGKRIIAGELPSEGQHWLKEVASVAYNQAKHNQTLLIENSDDVKRLISCAQRLKLRPHEALSSLLQCDSCMTGLGEHIVFQFVHDSHANFLAAYHVAESLRSSKNKERLIALFKDLQSDRQKDIILFFVSLIFQQKKEQKNVFPETQMMQDIGKLCEPHVKFNDITFLLEMIEESDFNTEFIKELAKCITGENPVTKTSTSKTPITTPKPVYDQLWLQPKHFKHSQALQMLLTEAKPARLWLRLCEGPRDDDEDQVRGHQLVEGDPVASMRVITRAYKGEKLPELRLSDVKVSTPLAWPKGLWWLSLERCNVKGDLGLRPGLLKLTLKECQGFKMIKFPSTVESIKLEGMDLHDETLPGNIKTLALTACTFQQMNFLPQNLKCLRLYQCPLNAEMTFPASLQHLTISSIMISHPKDGKLYSSFQAISTQLISRLQEATETLEDLQSLTVANVALSPEAFLDFFLDFEQTKPKCRLEVKSICELNDDSSVKTIIEDIVKNSSLPQIKIVFGKTKITRDVKLKTPAG